jgi:hypothetical protein
MHRSFTWFSFYILHFKFYIMFSGGLYVFIRFGLCGGGFVYGGDWACVAAVAATGGHWANYTR